jgi:dCMP deaminase
MILAIAGTVEDLVAMAADFTAARSFVAVKLKERGKILPIDALGHHYVLTGDFNMSTIEPLWSLRDFRLAFVGPAPIEENGPQWELFRSAHWRCEHSEGIQNGLLELVQEGMCCFERPDWDEYFMDIAAVVSRRGNCMKRRIAAVVVKDKRIVATGYNGTPRGARNCCDGGCERCNSVGHSGYNLEECLCCHAEENAIAQAALHGISIHGATIYSTHSPCLRCTKLIVNAGISEVVYCTAYPMAERSLALLSECKVQARRFSKTKSA